LNLAQNGIVLSKLKDQSSFTSYHAQYPKISQKLFLNQ
jgi:hypothetical protein